MKLVVQELRMEASSNLRRFLCAHYLVNLFLALSFLILKHVPIFCRYVFEECTLEWRDQETLMFCICVILAKTRKATTWVQYIGKACMFAKAASLVLFFREEPVLGFAYGVICLIAMIMFPEPAYDGPENITYFRGPFLDHELEREPRVTWIIEFYAAWSPACVDFVPTFAEISNKYSLDNLKYGKIDVTRYPDVAAQYKIDVSALKQSHQLPTLILFENGKEKMRKPYIDILGKKVIPYSFTEQNVMKDFKIAELYEKCKNNPLPTKRNKAAKEEKKEQ